MDSTAHFSFSARSERVLRTSDYFQKMSVIVFGSINIDLVARATRLPAAGETLTGHTFFTAPGGKGANQAVAAARLGTPTRMVGRVGDDVFGPQLLNSLQTAGVQTDEVLVDEGSSGVALITVDEAGENSIIVVPGANGRVDESDVARLSAHLEEATVLLLQLEIPLPAVVAAAQAARATGVTVVLDPAPAPESLPSDLFPFIDIITPNEVEARQLTGLTVRGPADAARVATVLRQRGVDTAIIKLGARGVYCATPDEHFEVSAFPVEVVDTVAAGDAFNGGLATALAAGLSMRDAVSWGAAAGALSVTRAGAHPSLPDREAFDAFLREHGVTENF